MKINLALASFTVILVTLPSTGFTKNSTIATHISPNDLNKDLNYSSKIQPWAGYWFPYADNEMVEHDDNFSALEKYGKILLKQYKILPKDYQKLLLWEKDHHSYEGKKSGPLIELFDWKGHCNGLCAASFFFNAPKKPVTIKGITLSPREQMAILVETSNHYSEFVIGNRTYSAQSEEYDEEKNETPIDPLKFHQFVVERLVINRLPFVMDISDSEKVTNKIFYEASFYFQIPVIKYASKYKKHKELYLVLATLDLSAPEYCEKKEGPLAKCYPKQVLTYYYDLLVTGKGEIKKAFWSEDLFWGPNRKISKTVEQARREIIAKQELKTLKGPLPRSWLQPNQFKNRYFQKKGFPFTKSWSGYRRSHHSVADSLDELPDFAWYPIFVLDNPKGKSLKNPYFTWENTAEVLPHLIRKKK